MVNVLVVPDNGCEFDSLVDFLLISNPIPQDSTNIREKTKANSGAMLFKLLFVVCETNA